MLVRFPTWIHGKPLGPLPLQVWMASEAGIFRIGSDHHIFALTCAKWTWLWSNSWSFCWCVFFVGAEWSIETSGSTFQNTLCVSFWGRFFMFHTVEVGVKIAQLPSFVVEDGGQEKKYVHLWSINCDFYFQLVLVPGVICSLTFQICDMFWRYTQKVQRSLSYRIVGPNVWDV